MLPIHFSKDVIILPFFEKLARGFIFYLFTELNRKQQ
jgi:hypothetical protein